MSSPWQLRYSVSVRYFILCYEMEIKEIMFQMLYVIKLQLALNDVSRQKAVAFTFIEYFKGRQQLSLWKLFVEAGNIRQKHSSSLLTTFSCRNKQY